MKHSTFLFLLLVSAIFLSMFFLFDNQKPKTKNLSFSKALAGCNFTATELRFSCYRSIIEKYYKGNINGFSQKIKNDKDLSFASRSNQNDKITYAIFGTNCHTFYHAAGDFIATYAKGDLKSILDLGPTNCTNGYTMGVYKRLAIINNYDINLLKKFYEICKEGAQNQCAHEIGHVLNDKYSYSILKHLDDISQKQYGLSYPQNYQYVSFEQSDINAPFDDCKKIMPDENKLAQCYTGIGHNLFLFGEFAKDNFRAVFDECAESDAKNTDNCYGFTIFRIGQNHAGTEFLNKNFSRGNQICLESVAQINRDGLEKHCYLGIGSGIGLWIDSEYSSIKIDDNNLVQIKKELLELALLCNEAEEAFKDNCFAGLLGTKFKKFYKDLGIYEENIERILPTIDSDFEVVG